MTREPKKISVFMDTNILQSFFSCRKGNMVFLGDLGISKAYYQLVDLSVNNQLRDDVEICIPEVVMKEIRQHMIKQFSKYCSELDSDIRAYKKVAGDLLEINYELKINVADYPRYVDGEIERFLCNPRNLCKLVPVPKDGEILGKLLDKALRGVEPFVSRTIDGKQYQDAGFKDAVIAETIFDYGARTGRTCLLVTGDKGFASCFAPVLTPEKQYVRSDSLDKAIEMLASYYQGNVAERLRREFQDNAYWHEVLLNSIEQEYDAFATDVEAVDVVQVQEEQYEVSITFVINETRYCFKVLFDAAANELMDYRYRIEND